MASSPVPNADAPTPIDCETAVRRLWDFLDGQLTPTAHGEVEAHLATCALCPPHFLFAGKMRASLATSAPPQSADEMDALRERVRAALAQALQ